MINKSDIFNIHKYLMVKNNTKKMFALIKQQFIGLLASIINASNHMKYMSIKNQQCMTNLLLLIYMLLNMVKKYVTIYF